MEINHEIFLSPACTLGTDSNKEFAWVLRRVNGQPMIFLHKRGADGWSFLNESDFITCFPADRIIDYINRI